MNERRLQFVLRCRQCNKPFDKESTLKRHGYYCRSSKPSSIARSRSCLSCAKSKARCDKNLPQCKRCMTKSIECHFPARTHKSTVPKSQQGSNAQDEGYNMLPNLVTEPLNVEYTPGAQHDDDSILADELATSVPEFTGIEGDYLDFSSLDNDLGNFLDVEINEDIVRTSSSMPSFLAHQSTPWSGQGARLQQVVTSLNTRIPAQPTSNIRSLLLRPKLKAGANLILHTLKSYPLMILRHNTLPPFIHPGLISTDPENNYMEPLDNCISLVHMISGAVQGSRRLFWRNVGIECERLCEEHREFTRWELLAAMQALSMYILIRLHEGETDHNNFDFLLLAAVTVVANKLNTGDITCNTETPPCKNSLEMDWKDWIFVESRRRLSVVFRVVNMLIYFEPVSICTLQTDLVLAPLPARRQLWEAGNEYAWKAESASDIGGVQTDFGLAANGELVKLEEGQVYCGNSMLLYTSLDTRDTFGSNRHWEEWCSGIDGFGGLVMLAASLIA